MGRFTTCDNAGTYLHANFSNAFANNLAVGCYPNNYNVRFTTAQAITDYLPANGKSEKLKELYQSFHEQVKKIAW